MTMQVNSLTSVPATSTADAAAPSDISPEELFYYCETQVNNCSDEVTGFFNTQQHNTTAKQKIADATNAVANIQSKLGTQDHIDDATDIDTAVAALNAAAQECPSIAAQVAGIVNTLTTNGQGGTDTVISAAELKSVTDGLQSANSNIDSDNQMLMIRMQSAMSAREQAIQLTTNMLQALNDSGTKVIANIHS